MPINKLSLVEVKSGVNLLLRHPRQLSSVQNSAQEILYDCTLLSRSAKRVKFDAVLVTDLPELVPDLPQAVVACEPEVLQDSGEIMFEPFYFQMWLCIVLTVYRDWSEHCEFVERMRSHSRGGLIHIFVSVRLKWLIGTGKQNSW